MRMKERGECRKRMRGSECERRRRRLRVEKKRKNEGERQWCRF
jgi:hypothetical protein